MAYSATQMTTFTALDDNTLKLDKPFTELVARAGMRDNVQATVEGDPSVPEESRIRPESILSPYFMASVSSYSPGSSSFKVAFDHEVADPYGLYDNTANSGNGYRFQPNKPGLYLVTVSLSFQISPVLSPASPTSGNVSAAIWKNGASFAGVSNGANNAFAQSCQVSVTALVPMNGSTDYIDAHGDAPIVSGPVTGNFSAVGVCQF